MGKLTDRATLATDLVALLRAKVAAIQDRVTDRIPRPRVWVCEWLDPPYAAGHWVSAQVEMAGGQEVFQRVGLPSTRVTPQDIGRLAPEVIILAPCGFRLDEVERETNRVTPFAGWHEFPAVKAGEVWAVDASSYFSRPGPRLVEGIELMASILHPEIFGVPDRDRARRVNLTSDAGTSLHFTRRGGTDEDRPRAWRPHMKTPGLVGGTALVGAICACRQPGVRRIERHPRLVKGVQR